VRYAQMGHVECQLLHPLDANSRAGVDASAVQFHTNNKK
jgi:hypothetical protein